MYSLNFVFFLLEIIHHFLPFFNRRNYDPSFFKFTFPYLISHWMRMWKWRNNFDTNFLFIVGALLVLNQVLGWVNVLMKNLTARQVLRLHLPLLKVLNHLNINSRSRNANAFTTQMIIELSRPFSIVGYCYINSRIVRWFAHFLPLEQCVYILHIYI